MVRERREANSLDDIFESIEFTNTSASAIPRTLVTVSDPEWSRREDNFKVEANIKPSVNDVESFFASVRVRKADGADMLAFADFNPEWQKSTTAEFQGTNEYLNTKNAIPIEYSSN